MGTMGQSITLANSIIGVGILAMPFCFQQCGVLLATVILILMGLISRLCCYFLLKSALLARRRNFEFLALHVFGSAGKFAVEVGIIGFLMGTCIAYFVVVGDLGPQIISKMFNINQSDMLRTSIMVIVSLVCVLPLGLLRNVDSLSNVSAATIGFYFCLVIKAECMGILLAAQAITTREVIDYDILILSDSKSVLQALNGSRSASSLVQECHHTLNMVIAEAASVLAGGAWTSRVEMWRPAGVLQCVPIFSMALFCQTQLFELFQSLPSLSLERMNLVTKNAINICTGVYFTLGLFGYIAFNTQEISGNILISLSPTMASDVIKLGFVMSLAFSFPLIIFPCRASIYSLLYKKVHSSHHDHIINHSIPEGSFRRITVGIVACALGASLVLPNIELVLGLVGSTIGVLVCLVFPATCFLHLTFKNTNERLLAKGILILGFVIMVLGTYANLQAAENQVDKYDEKYITKERIDKIVEDFFENMEKNNDVKLKPEPNGKIKEDTKKLNGDVIKESVALPPNPVPPESQSNEKNEHNAEVKNIPNIKQVLPNPIKNTVDKVSETHPKNLNKGNEVKMENEDTETKNKEETLNNDKKTNEDAKPQANEEKINIIKQQKLIETIKQHGEEQKELIKEQKEILSEIHKTKQELEKNKNEAANEEAKKIAVESIKKIANIAMQSLAGVSDKPDQAVEEKKPGVLEKLADEAVQEIALKAVEAIKEIKEKPDLSIKLPILPNNLPASHGEAPVNNVGINNNQNAPVNIANPAPQGPFSNNNPAPVNQNGNNPNAANSQVVQNNINTNHQQNLPSANTNQQLNLPPVNLPQPVQSLNQLNNQVASNNDAGNIGQVAVNNGQAAQNIGQVANSNGQVAQNIGQAPNNNGQAVQNIGQDANNVSQAPQKNVQAPVNNNQVASNVNQPSSNNQANVPQPAANIPEPAHIVKRVAPEINSAQPETNINLENNQQVIHQNAQSNIQPNQVVQNEVNQNQQPNQNVKPQENVVKEHSHSPDEPQSYKQGEDSQKKNNIQQANNVIDPKVPLAVAMNGNSQINNQPNNIPKTDDKNKNIQNSNQAADKQDNIANLASARQKREVVDCTEKSALKPEDKDICKALIDVPNLKIVDNNVDDILSAKVDLNEVGLSKTLPILPNGLNHLSRSLKSVKNDKR